MRFVLFRNSVRSWRKSSEEPGRVSESSQTERQEEETVKEEINRNEEEGKIKKEMEKQESKVGGNEHAHSEVGTSRLNVNSSVVWLPPKLRKSKTFPPVLSPCNASNLPLELSHTGASNVPPVFSPSNASNVPSELSFCDASNVPPESNLCDASNVPPESNSCDASNVSQSLYDVPVQLNRRRLSEPWNSTKRNVGFYLFILELLSILRVTCPIHSVENVTKVSFYCYKNEINEPPNSILVSLSKSACHLQGEIN